MRGNRRGDLQGSRERREETCSEGDLGGTAGRARRGEEKRCTRESLGRGRGAWWVHALRETWREVRGMCGVEEKVLGGARGSTGLGFTDWWS